MASFLVIADPDRSRRAADLGRLTERLAPFDGLETRAESVGDVDVAWAAGSHVPVSVNRSGDELSILLGDAIDPDGARLAATDLRARWPDAETASASAAVDGLHIGIRIGRDGTVVVGADLLGILPVYYWAGRGVLLVASSPELFRRHSTFVESTDPAGLAGLLLLGHAMGGRTLFRDVRRLAPGHLLVVRNGEPEIERLQYSLPLTTEHFDLPFSAQLERLFEALDRAVRRHAWRPATAMLLSGGRDSRMLAGLLHRHGRAVDAVTFGRAEDLEMSCAALAAKHLGFRHHRLDIPPEVYPDLALRMARWEHLSGGLPYCDPWGLDGRTGPLPDAIVSGLVMDPIVGGSHIRFAYSPKKRELGFKTYFAEINRFGFSPDALRTLLRPGPPRDAVDAVLEEIRRTFDAYGPSPSKATWCFDLLHRQRLFAGRAAWPISFVAWPVLPAVDREVLAVCGGLPTGSLAERRLQDAILIEKFPLLAELPLDRNSFDTTPLSPRFRDLLARHLAVRLRSALGTRWWSERRDLEALYFHRTFSINSAMWAGVRENAEPHRARLFDVFEPEALRRALPPPGELVETPDPIVDSNRAKLLLGLMLRT